MAQPARRTLDPKLDVVFKILFAHPESTECLTSLLTAVLRPTSPIVEVEVLNPEVPRQDAFEKGVVLDLRVRMADDSLVDVEMQSQRREGSRKRILYYWAKSYDSQLGRGGAYATLEPVVVVVFTDYRELEAERLHSTFRLLEVTDHDGFCDDLEIHLIELPKLNDMTATNEQAERLLRAWARFLAARTDEEVEAAAKEDEMIEQAKGVLERLSEDPKVRELASWREAHLALDQMQRRMELEKAQAEGRTKGEARGRAEGEARGRAEGRTEGRTEGEARGRRAMLRLIERRFGALTPEQVAQVEAVDLESLGDRLLEAKSLEELLGE